MNTLSLPDAIARMEGFGVSGSRAQRNHNPGNIIFSAFAKNHGAVGSDGHYAIFPDAEAGFEALSVLLRVFYGHLTLAQAIAKYAPPNENDTQNYLKLICEWTGAQPTDIVSSVLEPRKDSAV